MIAIPTQDFEHALETTHIQTIADTAAHFLSVHGLQHTLSAYTWAIEQVLQEGRLSTVEYWAVVHLLYERSEALMTQQIQESEALCTPPSFQ